MFGPSKRDLLRLLEQERKAHRVELANLLDRVAALADRPWTLPPRDTEEEPRAALTEDDYVLPL
jgi:hypothetical protein